MKNMTINGTELTTDQTRVIRIGLAGFLAALEEPTFDEFRDKKLEAEYKIQIYKIFKLMKNG